MDDFTSYLPFIVTVTILLVIVLYKCMHIVPENKRAVVFRLGEAVGVRGPGLVFFVPLLDIAVVVDLAKQAFEYQVQRVMTAKGRAVVVTVTAAYRVIDAEAAVTMCADIAQSFAGVVEEQLRLICGEESAENLSRKRGQYAGEIKQVVASKVTPLGLEVMELAISDVQFCEN